MDTLKQFWVVGRGNYKLLWDFKGVFDTKERALAACVAPDYFIGSVIVNMEWPAESNIWFGVYYPNRIQKV